MTKEQEKQQKAESTNLAKKIVGKQFYNVSKDNEENWASKIVEIRVGKNDVTIKLKDKDSFVVSHEDLRTLAKGGKLSARIDGTNTIVSNFVRF